MAFKQDRDIIRINYDIELDIIGLTQIDPPHTRLYSSRTYTINSTMASGSQNP